MVCGYLFHNCIFEYSNYKIRKSLHSCGMEKIYVEYIPQDYVNSTALYPT